MKLRVERMGLEEEHPTGKKKEREEGQRVCAHMGPKHWQQDPGLGSVPKELQALACPNRLSCSLSTAPFSGCQGIVLMDLPTCCSSHSCPKLAGLEGPVRQPKAVSSGKDVLCRQL